MKSQQSVKKFLLSQLVKKTSTNNLKKKLQKILICVSKNKIISSQTLFKTSTVKLLSIQYVLMNHKIN